MLLYLALIDGDEDKCKFERIYDRYRGLMYHVADRILHNPQDAEDAVHQAFLSIAKNIEKISDPLCNKTRSYVVTIVENKAIDLYRAKQRRAALPLDEETAGVRFDASDNGVAAAIARLPARYRSFILLKYDNGYNNQELAQLLGLTYAGVRSLDARAKQALRRELAQEGIDV